MNNLVHDLCIKQALFHFSILNGLLYDVAGNYQAIQGSLFIYILGNCLIHSVLLQERIYHKVIELLLLMIY